MNSGTKAFAYLFAGTSQAIGILWFCHYLTPWLEKSYPIGQSWQNIMMGVGLLSSAYIYYAILKVLVKEMDKK